MEDYAQLTYSPELAADCSQTSSSDTGQCSPSSGKNPVADHCAAGCKKDGCQQTCTSTVETCESSTSHHGPAEWIASQRASLARIFHALDQAKESKASAPALSGKCSEQLTLFGPGWCSLKTRQKLGPKVDATLSGLSWREDIPGKTERLPLLLSEQVIAGIVGGCSLPTLTVTSNWNRKGSGEKSGDGLATRLKRLPTLCSVDSKRSGGAKVTPKTMSRLPTLYASDYKSPHSEAGYQKQVLKRSKPLRDTLAHTVGHRLTPEFAEWWMGWPLRWTDAPKERALKRVATGKCRSKRQPRG